ncbi:NUDIX hydrolase domain-like protein [Xylariaceae sp. FL0662B]|nr:NUDIX hydrolase domain-like protein [Xylariaceae sp. FL0662B]
MLQNTEVLPDTPSGSAPQTPITTFDSSPAVAAFKQPLRAYLDAHPKFDGIAVGACVFSPDAKLLLLQRAAHDSMPLLWEIPGGACDLEDESLLHAVARELWEESRLRLRSVVGLVGDGDGDVFFTRRNLRMCKYSFVAEVDAYDVQLDPNEHEAFLWVTEEEAKARKCGDVKFRYTNKDQENVIHEAFRLKKEMA